MALARILEPEWMEDADEAATYDSMDHDAVNAAFVDDLVAGGPVGPDVLDMGTGTAAIAVRLCQVVAETRVFAVDAATSMLDLAVYRIEVAGLNDRIQLGRADAKVMEGFADEMFDTVISNSLLHHLPEPLLALQQAVRLTRFRGRLFFRDLCRPASPEQREQLVAQHAGGETEHAQQLLRQSFDAALTLLEAQDLAQQVGFDRDCVAMTSDRHWTLDATR